MTVRELFVAMGFKVDESSLNKVEGKISSVKSFATKALQAIRLEPNLAQAEILANEFNEINDKAQDTADELKNQKESQEKIKKSAKETKKSYEGAAQAVDTLKGKLEAVLKVIGIGLSLAQMNALAEEFNGINDQIKSATSGLGNQKEIQEKIMKSANDTKMSYADTAKVISALVQENKELFGSVDEAVAFNDALVKTFKTAGKSNEEISGLMEAVNKSFAKGKVDTETLNQLMERSPEAVAYLNKQLGSTTDQLEQMASDGRISLSDLKNAFLSNTDEINAAFDGLDYSISDGLLNIRNRWGYWLDDINASTGLTRTLAKFMTRAFDIVMKGLNKVRDIAVKVTEKFGGMENVLKFIGIVAGAAIAAFKGKKILDFLKSFTGFLNVANLKMLAVIAVIVMIALIVEDFINFMQGNGSVIGEVLEKMGFDVDEVRDRIITAWSKVKGFLTQVWLAISGAVSAVVEFMGGLWEKYGDRITEVFSSIFSFVKTQLGAFIEFIQGIIDVISGLLSGDVDKTMAGIQKILEGASKAGKSILEAIYALFGEKIDAMLEKLTGFVKKVKEKIQDIKDYFGGIGEKAGEFFSDVGDFFSGDTTVKNTTVSNATGTGNRTNNVSQDVKIENKFYGTDQETMSKAATKSAEDTTDQLAKGLKYGT